MTHEVTIVPANEASCKDLRAVFGTRGAAATCWCQRYKLRPREAFAKFPAEERAARLRRQTDCGHPESDTTSSLVEQKIMLEEMHVGNRSMFAAAGFTEVNHPTLRRVVVRIDF